MVSPPAAQPLAGKMLLLVQDGDLIADLLVRWLSGLGAHILRAEKAKPTSSYATTTVSNKLGHRRFWTRRHQWP